MEERRQIDHQEGLGYAHRNSISFLEVSARRSEDIRTAFTTILEQIMENVQNSPDHKLLHSYDVVPKLL